MKVYINWIKLSKKRKPVLSGDYLVLFEEFGFLGNYYDIATYHHLEDVWVIHNKEYKKFKIAYWAKPDVPFKVKQELKKLRGL